MSRNHGNHTLEDFRQRCHEDEFSECWIWKGYTKRSTPLIYYAKDRCHMSGPRLALELSGRAREGYLPLKCKQNCLCVNPRHLKLIKAFDWYSQRSLKPRENLLVMARSADCMLGHSKLNWEKAAEIRASSEPDAVLAKRYNVHVRSISNVRQLKCWKPVHLPNSIFNIAMQAA